MHVISCRGRRLNLVTQQALKVLTVSHILGRVQSITSFLGKVKKMQQRVFSCHVLHDKQKVLGLLEH